MGGFNSFESCLPPDTRVSGSGIHTIDWIEMSNPKISVTCKLLWQYNGILPSSSVLGWNKTSTETLGANSDDVLSGSSEALAEQYVRATEAFGTNNADVFVWVLVSLLYDVLSNLPLRDCCARVPSHCKTTDRQTNSVSLVLQHMLLVKRRVRVSMRKLTSRWWNSNYKFGSSHCTEQLAGKISMVVFDTVRASASAVEAAGDR